MTTWRCSTCGLEHSGVPNSYGYDAPWTWYTIPEHEREQRSYLDPDYCVIDNEDFSVRACLDIPIIGSNAPFIWGVWVSLNRANYERERSLAKNPKRVKEQPYFGWLSSRIEIYPDTAALETNVHTRYVGQRPWIELEPTDHPLAVEQREGMTEDRMVEIAEKVQHGWRHPLWDHKQF